MGVESKREKGKDVDSITESLSDAQKSLRTLFSDDQEFLEFQMKLNGVGLAAEEMNERVDLLGGLLVSPSGMVETPRL